MKIEAIRAENIDPIRNLAIEGMGNIVIIAGANGSGKSRLKQAIVQAFQSLSFSNLELTIQSTREEEEASRWGSEVVTLGKQAISQAFTQYINSTTRGRTYTGTIIQIDSSRSVQALQFQPLYLTTTDPDDDEIDYRYFLNPFTGRWNETVNRIYRKVAARDTKIARYNMEHPDGRIAEALAEHPDPFIPYQDLFAKLLPGKTLEPINPKAQREFHYRLPDGQVLPFTALSSGEQEVVKISFDLLAKQITHCVFLIDEPELHLHPTLTFRLIETMKDLGGGTNQFIFFTHSADLISTYYSTGNVYFIDAEETGGNQAHRLSELDTGHRSVVQAMSENLGLFAVGKKLIFIEGQQSSRDRLTYHSIAQRYFPEAYVIPSGSADTVMGLSRFAQELNAAIFGIDFFMIRDRDGLTDNAVAELEVNQRLRCLERRHLENYFLDATVLAQVAARFCLPREWHDAKHIGTKLKETAEQALGEALILNLKELLRLNRSLEIPTVKAIQTKSVSDVEQEFLQLTTEAVNQLSAKLSSDCLEEAFSEERLRLEQSLQTNDWNKVFPGKLIFERFCGNGGFGVDSTRVRQAYVEIALAERPVVFQDIISIFECFKNSNPD